MNAVPELPDIENYIAALQSRIKGKAVEDVRIGNPFIVRTFDPSIQDAKGRKVTDISRLGKRIVFSLAPDFHLVLHLMIAGRLHWRKLGAAITQKNALLAFDFADGCLVLTEAGSKRRASLHCVRDEDLHEHDPGGAETLEISLSAFTEILTCENHTLKRSLTDPRLFSGIGNAYSDEILHHARLSPIRQTKSMAQEEFKALYDAVRFVLPYWRDKLRAETGDRFPEGVTAFHPDMAVHGKFNKPCPDCATPVQRIVHASNEVNYCPRCQTGGKLLADRALSRLLHKDWPKTIDELENLKAVRKASD